MGRRRETERRRKAIDYHKYYWEQCHKLAPRTIDWDSHAFESVLALLMVDYPDEDRGAMRDRVGEHAIVRAAHGTTRRFIAGISVNRG